MSYSIKRYFSQNVKDQIFAEKAESQKNKFKNGGICSRAEQIPPPAYLKLHGILFFERVTAKFLIVAEIDVPIGEGGMRPDKDSATHFMCWLDQLDSIRFDVPLRIHSHHDDFTLVVDQDITILIRRQSNGEDIPPGDGSLSGNRLEGLPHSLAILQANTQIPSSIPTPIGVAIDKLWRIVDPVDPRASIAFPSDSSRPAIGFDINQARLSVETHDENGVVKHLGCRD